MSKQKMGCDGECRSAVARIEAAAVPVFAQNEADGIEYSSAMAAAQIDRLLTTFPFLGHGIIGKSVLGKDIAMLRFGRGPLTIIYNASHHANEYITTPILLRFLSALCSAATRGADFFGENSFDIFEEVSLYLVPMVNPDGVDLVTGAIGPGTDAYEAAYSIKGQRVTFPSGWKANIRGVDLNNNYPALFERGVEEKEQQGINYPGPRDYPGPYPLSEPESAAMAKVTKELGACLTIALHTQGREIYWRFNDIEPPDSERIGEAMVASSPLYRLVDPPGASYGGYKDWFIQDFNRPGYTLEIGVGINPLPMSELDALFGESMPILATGIVELMRACR